MDLTEARELVAAERARVQQLLDEMLVERGQDVEAANEPGDLFDPATPLVIEETDDAIIASLHSRLEALQRAERRTADGTYGRSVKSGRVIPDERLRADPAAELLVEEVEEG